MALLGRASPSDRLSAAFGRAVRSRAVALQPVVGIEHEYRVLGEDGRPVDFGRLIGSLVLDGVRLDPADPHAIRGPWGGAITADDREAEVAVPPVTVGPGFSKTATARARIGRDRLVAALTSGLTLEGYSTHISVEVADGVAERAALRFARVFAPALMLLLDGRRSPGLLVRPRPGRLELGGEFVDGDRLRAAILFATGCAQATVASLGRRPWRRRRIPDAIRLQLEPATERFGWFVSRTAAGSDLYAGGRRAMLPLVRGGAITAQEHLERCWAAARPTLVGQVTPEELDLVDAYVLGDLPLGLEVEHERAIAIEVTPRLRKAAAPDSPFGSALAIRRRGNLRVEPAVVSWDFVVLRISGQVADGEARVAFACLPRSVLGPALQALDTGHLDGLLRAYLATGGPGRRLSTASQTRSPGLYRSVGTAARLLRSEHGPAGTGERPGKRDRESREFQEQPAESPATPRSLTTAAAAAAALTIFGLPAAAAAAVAGVTAVAVLGGVMLLGSGPTAGPSAASIASSSAAPTSEVTLPVPTPPGVTAEPFTFEPFMPEFTTGTASMRVTGDSTGSAEMTFGGEHNAGEAGGPSYPVLLWNNADSSQVLAIYLLQRHAVGTFSTDDGTLGLTVWLDLRRFSSTEQYATGSGLGHAADRAFPEPCTATIASTPTGGITGTLSCPNINHPSLVYRLEATFAAEPPPPG